MKTKEIKEFLNPLTKDELRNVISLAESQLNSSLGIGDSVNLVIDYMIGDANGDTEKECDYYIETQDDLDALNIVTHILDNHTSPNSGTWGFIMDERNFSKKPDEVFNILYNQEEAPEEYSGIKLNENILKQIQYIKSECFRGETEYSFLVYQGYDLVQ